MSVIIYLLTNTITGQQYIGQTSCGLTRRWNQHCRYARLGSTAHLHRAIHKYGPEAFTRQIWEETTAEDADIREMYWIAELKTKEQGYNMTEGGGGLRGWSHSEEVKKKISSSQVGKLIPEETRQKLREKATGRYKGISRSPEFCKAVSDGLKGHKKTEEWIDKINRNPEKIAKTAAKHRGMKRTPEQRARMGRKKGCPAWNKGLKMSSDAKAKMNAKRKLRARINSIQAPPITINIT